MKIIVMIFLSLFVASSLFAEIDLEATGYDWIKYTPKKKKEYVDTVYKIFKVEDGENGVAVLDGFYAGCQAGLNPEGDKVLMNAPLIRILVDAVTYNPKMNYKQELFERNKIPNIINVAIGRDFVITLDANATTGYEWQLANRIDDSMVKLADSKYVPDKTGLVGSSGKSIWAFIALRAGKTRISFKYVRPWEKYTKPAREAKYVVYIRE